MPAESGPVVPVPVPADAAAVLALHRALVQAGPGVATDAHLCRRVLAALLPAEPLLAAALAAVVATGLPGHAARVCSATELRAVTARALRALVDDGVPEAVAQRAIGCWIAARDAGRDAPATRLRPAAGLLTGPTTIVPLAGQRTTARVAARPATARLTPPWWTGRGVQIAAVAVVVGAVMTGSTLLLSAMRGTTAADAHRLAAAVVPVSPVSTATARPAASAASSESAAPPRVAAPDLRRSAAIGGSSIVVFRSPVPSRRPAPGPETSAPPSSVPPSSGATTPSAPTSSGPVPSAPASSDPPTPDPPTTTPPSSEPPSSDPPSSDPPATDPPSVDPPSTDEPSPDPATTSPDATDPVPSSAPSGGPTS